jgi:hypothetical protein
VSLHREFKVINETVLKIAINFIESNWKQLAADKTPMFLIATTAEEKRRAQQNKYYFGTVIRSIAKQAWINGRQYSAEAWHEQMARTYGQFKDVTLPDGEVVVKRLSTTEMSVKDFAKYTEQVMAYGATELGIRFPAPEYY